MKIEIDKSFEKDVSKITDRKVLKNISEIIEDIETCEKIFDIRNCKKLKDSSNAYRIRSGTYRIGFAYEEQTIYFVRFLKRKDIYKYFPR